MRRLPPTASSATPPPEQGRLGLLRVSVLRPLPDGLYVEAERIMQAAGGTARVIADIGGIGSLRGVHNAQNAACAAGAALALGLSRDSIQRGLVSFPGLAHRMEQVGHKGRVLFVNDSKATNVEFDSPGAGLFLRYFLDRGRQGQDRWYRLAGTLLPAPAQGLSHR